MEVMEMSWKLKCVMESHGIVMETEIVSWKFFASIKFFHFHIKNPLHTFAMHVFFIIYYIYVCPGYDIKLQPY